MKFLDLKFFSRLLFVLSCLFFAALGHSVKAATADDVVFGVGSSYGVFTNTAVGQRFRPNENNFVGIRFNAHSQGISTTMDWYLCKGVPDAATFNATYACGAAGNSFVASSSVTVTNNTPYQSYTATLTAPVVLFPGDDYYLAFQAVTGNTVVLSIGSNSYGNGALGTIEAQVYKSGFGLSGGISLFDTLYNYSSATVYWSGVGVQTATIGGRWSVPVFYNVCNDFANIPDLTASMAVGGDDVGYPSVLIYDTSLSSSTPACSGIVYLTGDVVQSSPESGTSTIQLSSSVASPMVESSAFYYSINRPGSATNRLEPSFVSPLNIIQDATTTLRFDYDFTGIDLASTTLCLFNNSSQRITDFCTTVAAAKGAAAIDIPSPHSNYGILAKAVLYSSTDVPLVNSSDFQINWQLAAGGLGASVDSNNLYGVSNEDMACTASEWATPDPVFDFGFGTTTISAFNFTVMKCQVILAMLDLSTTGSRFLQSSVITGQSMAARIFPFNLPINFYNSWQSATATSLPADLSYFDVVDGSGNIYLSVPAQMNGSATSSSMLVFGHDVFTATSSLSAFFAAIRSLSTYLLWALFIYFIYYSGSSLYKEVTDPQGK